MKLVEGPDAIRQKLSARFKFFLAEWFLDQRQGIPYYRDVFTKNPNLDVVRSLFKKVILGCPGVLSLASYSLSFDESARQLTFRFQAMVTGGVVSVAPEDQDFILDLAA
ncbi:MAG TPA: hypothetical protein VER11_34500 [Polyangiaceae bacterium]|nr:hypothetical protein [Polyangiaceae bacterium]